MAHTSESEPHVLDQPWRIWASVAIFGIVLSGIVLGVVIIPVVQGRSDGIDAYHRDLPSARNFAGIARTATGYRSHATDTGFASGVDARPAANSRRRKTGTGSRQSARGLRRLSWRARRVGRLRRIRILPANRARRFTSNSTTIEPAAERIS